MRTRSLLLPSIMAAGAILAPMTASTAGLPGETLANPIIIPGLDFSDQGNTCAYAHDYDEVCPFENSIAPDIVYAVASTESTRVRIDLCSSDYDTKVYVYEDDPANLVACNDDACGVDGYRSRIWAIDVAPPHTYYIVIDGYGSACGDYVLDVTDQGPCEMTCPGSGWWWEGEPVCHDDYQDHHNGGCGSDPVVFHNLDPDPGTIRICGESGTFLYDGFAVRESDWYEIRPRRQSSIEIHCEAEFPVALVLLDGRQGCGGMEVMESASAGPCDPPAAVNRELEPGTYWVWVAPDAFSGVPCGSRYRLWIDGYQPVAAGAWVVPPEPGTLRLTAQPSPSRDAIRIAYELPRSSPVRLIVVDVAGRIVRRLRDGVVEAAGAHVAVWDGRDHAGRPAPSGVYALVLDCDAGRATGTVVWLR